MDLFGTRQKQLLHFLTADAEKETPADEKTDAEEEAPAEEEMVEEEPAEAVKPVAKAPARDAGGGRGASLSARPGQTHEAQHRTTDRGDG